MPARLSLLLTLLLTALLQINHASNIFITPPFPSTAFIGQTYTVRFQGSGLVKPSFNFLQLPPFLKGFANGTVTGAPTETGSFKVIISYIDKTHNGTADVIISVADNNTDSVNLAPSQQILSNPLYLSFSDGSRTFQVGEAIDIGFQCINAVEPIAVSYNSLPDGLIADISSIQGSIQVPGLYTFSVVVGDGVGYRTLSFITLNIQPKNANFTTNLVDVPIKNQELNIDSMALQALQSNAQNVAKRALQKAISARNSLTMAQNAVYNSANSLTLAQQASTSYQQAYTQALQNLNSLQTFINNWQNAIKSSTIAVSLANSSLSQTNEALLSSQTTYDSALAVFQNHSQSFNISVSNMALASQASSDANTQYNQLSAAAIAARNAFNAATNNLEVMKQNKDIAQAMLDNANQVTPIARLNVQLATQDNDAATANFNTALTNVEISKNNTYSIESYIQEGRKALQQAKHDVGVVTFNLQQANNNLFVAQAAKQAADKAIAIIVAQGFAQVAVQSTPPRKSSSAIPLSTSFAFRGCDNYAYPSMFGTETVIELLSNGAKTSGGHRIAWGQCTKKSAVRIGDQIYYQGNLIQSTINLWLLVNLSA